MDTTLESAVEVSLSSTTSQNLSLDHQIILAYTVSIGNSVPLFGMVAQLSKRRVNVLKLLATCSASSAENAGRAFGVGIPYCPLDSPFSSPYFSASPSRILRAETYRVEQLDRLVLVDREESFLLRDGRLNVSILAQVSYPRFRRTFRTARAEVIPRNIVIRDLEG